MDKQSFYHFYSPGLQLISQENETQANEDLYIKVNLSNEFFIRKTGRRN